MALRYYTKNASDNELWQGLREENEDAFTELASRYYRKLMHYGQKFTSHAQLIEDALQELMINLWLHRKSINDTPSVKFYLMKAYRNQLFKTIKTNNKTAAWQDYFEEMQTELSSEEIFLLKEEESDFKVYVEKMLGNLTDRQKEVIYLSFYQGLSHDQIADMLAIKTQSVSNIIQRALGKLRENWILTCSLLWLYFQLD